MALTITTSMCCTSSNSSYTNTPKIIISCTKTLLILSINYEVAFFLFGCKNEMQMYKHNNFVFLCLWSTQFRLDSGARQNQDLVISTWKLIHVAGQLSVRWKDWQMHAMCQRKALKSLFSFFQNLIIKNALSH